MKDLRSGAGLLLLVVALGTGAAAVPQADKPGISSRIDGAVSNKGPGADDGEFLRRVMFDIVGYPPNAEELKQFYHDTSPKKRLAKIDELLATEEFADFWSRRFMEVFFGNYHNVPMEQIKPEPSGPARAKIVNSFRETFKAKLAKDAPWNEIVFDIMEARGKSENDPLLAYKLSMWTGDGHALEFASQVSRHFLGIRLLCARCHDHPFDGWKNDDYYGLAAFNVREMARGYGDGGEKDRSAAVEIPVKEATSGEIMDRDSDGGMGAGKAMAPKWLFGGSPGKYENRMSALAQLMTHKSNTWLARALANRVWGWLMGRGIVHPVDDFNRMRLSKQEPKGLLEPLTKDVVENKYSLKHLIRGICASNAYQLSCAVDTKSEKQGFGQMIIQPLCAEQLDNAIHVATEGTKPPRGIDRALQIGNQLFPPGAVWCETTPLPANARQALYMRNNQEVSGKINGRVLGKIGSLASPEEKVQEMFLAALSRMPFESELKRYVEFLKGGSLSDAYWSLLNTPEFGTRH
jgi:hypothetical protein